MKYSGIMAGIIVKNNTIEKDSQNSANSGRNFVSYIVHNYIIFYPMIRMFDLENTAGFKDVITFTRYLCKHDYTPLITTH